MIVMVVDIFGEGYTNRLRAEFPDVTFLPAKTLDEQKAAIREAEVCCGYIPREVFLEARKLRWLAIPGTGIDGIVAIRELVASDVVVTNVRGPHANPMADHVFGFVLTLAHRLHEQWEWQKEHRWASFGTAWLYPELSGSRMGILAFGDIGQAVARRANGFGMEVIAVDAKPVAGSPHARAVWGLERLDELLAWADWFVVTAPLTAQTRNLIDRRRIGLLKRGAYLIVISRGGIVDEIALADALRSGHLAGAGLDTVAQEPLPPDSPLWDVPNLLLTSHTSALTKEMWEGRQRVFIENLRRYRKGEPLLFVCDKAAGF